MLRDYVDRRAPTAELGHADKVLEVCRERMRCHWRIVTGPPHMSRAQLLAKVMRGAGVAAAVSATAKEKGVSEAAVKRDAERILRGMASDYRCWAVRCMRVFMQWLITTMFNAVYLDEAGLAAVRKLIHETGCVPVVYVPTHKSHMDYLLVSEHNFAGLRKRPACRPLRILRWATPPGKTEDFPSLLRDASCMYIRLAQCPAFARLLSVGQRLHCRPGPPLTARIDRPAALLCALLPRHGRAQHRSRR